MAALAAEAGSTRRDPPRRRVGWWRWALSLGLLVALVAIAGPRELAATFARVDPWLALAVIAISLAWLLLAGFKVWILLRRLAPIRLLTFLPVYGTSWAAALLLPSQLGDATQVLMLRRHAVPAARSGAAYLVDKFFSLGWLFLVAVYGVGRFTPGLQGWWLALPPLAAVAAALAGWALLRRARPRPGSLMARAHGLIWETLRQLRELRQHRGALALNLTLTLVKWLVMASLYMTAFRAFGTSVPFVAAATLPVMSSLVGYLPITVGGAGAIELTGVFLFGLIGVESATAVAVFLFFRVELLVIALVLVALGGAADRRGTAVAP